MSIRRLEAISGIDRSNLSKYENGHSGMEVNTAVKLALALNCKLDDLFEYKED